MGSLVQIQADLQTTEADILVALETEVDNFLAQLSRKKSTKATYRRMLRQFVSFLLEEGLLAKLGRKDLRKVDIVAYKEALEESGKEAHTVSAYLTAVRRFFSYLQGAGIYPDIAKDVEGPKKPKGHRKEWLSGDQIRQVLGGIDRSSLDGLRDYALINLLARTGLRTIEIARATVGDIRQKQGAKVLYIQGKNRSTKDEFVVLTQEALEPIREYHLARGTLLLPDEPLFSSSSNRNFGEALTPRSISRICKDRMKAVGLDDNLLTAHSLRHSAITLSILGGASLVQAQAMARHSDPRTTQIYFHNIERVSLAAEKLVHF